MSKKLIMKIFLKDLKHSANVVIIIDRSLKIWGRTGFDWTLDILCARQRAARLCKNAETLNANDNVDFDYALAA